MATVALSHTGFGSEEVVPFGDRIEASAHMDTDFADPLSTEIDSTARLLCALSTHTSLRDAMLSYHSELPEPKALHWAEQVLRRMDAILPSNTAFDLARTYDYSTPWAKDEGRGERPSFVNRLALPAVVSVGVAMFAMCLVGFVTTYHYLFAR